MTEIKNLKISKVVGIPRHKKKELIFGVQGDYSEIEQKINNASFWDEEQKNKLFKCPYDKCPRTFKEKGNLRTHIRVHTGERPYICHYVECAKAFITMGNLKSHLCNHTGEKPYVCPVSSCQKRYSRLCRLNIHQRTHTGAKPFICSFKDCGKSFNERGNLKTHFRIHSGEKPYVCNFKDCGHSFKAHGHLKDHEKRHYNIRPYECKYCHNKFARSSTLKIHLHTHTGEKPYPCEFPGCERKFTERGNMKTHFTTHKKRLKGRISESQKSLLTGSTLKDFTQNNNENTYMVVENTVKLDIQKFEKEILKKPKNEKLELEQNQSSTIYNSNLNNNYNQQHMNLINLCNQINKTTRAFLNSDPFVNLQTQNLIFYYNNINNNNINNNYNNLYLYLNQMYLNNPGVNIYNNLNNLPVNNNVILHPDTQRLELLKNIITNNLANNTVTSKPTWFI